MSKSKILITLLFVFSFPGFGFAQSVSYEQFKRWQWEESGARGQFSYDPRKCVSDNGRKLHNWSLRMNGQANQQVICDARTSAIPKKQLEDRRVFTNYLDYNQAWNDKINKMILQTEPQNGAECVCNAMANVLTPLLAHDQELVSVADLKRAKVVCDDSQMFEPFLDLAKGKRSNYAYGSKVTRGEVFGGMFGIIAKNRFFTTVEALERIAIALDDGHVVAISLSSSILWRSLAETNREIFTGDVYEKLMDKNDFSDAHAVRVVGLLRDETGNVAGFTVADPALIVHARVPDARIGNNRNSKRALPTGVYSVTIENMLHAYEANPATRGVYISQEKRYMPMQLKVGSSAQ
jgi:hypothetical protein